MTSRVGSRTLETGANGVGLLERPLEGPGLLAPRFRERGNTSDNEDVNYSIFI